ncbi:MAG TPA: TraR/DksA C4-type zinc finger protein [Actinomycetota bacterium]|nr:TraR/DksA C4-type zinc finger protein [Actinomycetota bacterium]
MDGKQLDDARTLLEAEKAAVDRQLLDHGVRLEGDEGISIESHEGFADSAQVTAERSQQITLVEQLRSRRADILKALRKIDDGTYGKCENCGNDIPVERLEAVPAATLCVSCKQQAG